MLVSLTDFDPQPGFQTRAIVGSIVKGWVEQCSDTKFLPA